MSSSANILQVIHDVNRVDLTEVKCKKATSNKRSGVSFSRGLNVELAAKLSKIQSAKCGNNKTLKSTPALFPSARPANRLLSKEIRDKAPGYYYKLLNNVTEKFYNGCFSNFSEDNLIIGAFSKESQIMNRKLRTLKKLYRNCLLQKFQQPKQQMSLYNSDADFSYQVLRNKCDREFARGFVREVEIRFKIVQDGVDKYNLPIYRFGPSQQFIKMLQKRNFSTDNLKS